MFFHWFILAILILSSSGQQYTSAWRPCQELSPSLKFPCKCSLELNSSNQPFVKMNCDHAVFASESPAFISGTPLVFYSQRYSGQQLIPSQVFAISGLPIRTLDFSHNSIRKLAEKQFLGIEETLIDLRLNDNLLGDLLNPIFSTPEFHILKNLRTLDLSGNKMSAIEEGLLKGCVNLQELYLDRNNFQIIPAASLNGPKGMKILSMTHNNIAYLQNEQFSTQRSLERIDLRYNQISTIDGGAFQQLINPKEILLGSNRISKLNSDVFEGAETLQKLDLSQNFINIFPNNALLEISNIKDLNLSSNMIQNIGAIDFESITKLQILDLSRNNIASVPPATFRDLTSMRYLDLSLNSLRTIEDDALEGLDSLQTLIIRDNNILLIPGSALGRLPHLSNLYLDFNRVAALSSDILGSIQPEAIKYMSLSRNVIRELPAGSFQMFKNLIFLDLSGNSLAQINADTFTGLELSLQGLILSENKITNIGKTPLNLINLSLLDLSENNIVDIPRNVFTGVTNLTELNLSKNQHLSPFSATIFHPLIKLRRLNLNSIGLKQLPNELFANSPKLEMISLRRNLLRQINESSFVNLKYIQIIDLAENQIFNIKPAAFVNVMNINQLYLQGNQLTEFMGEIFNTGSSLETLDLSNNRINDIQSNSFRVHPRLRQINAAYNNLSVFPSELIISLQYLEMVNLTGNSLRAIDELNFARLPLLRELIVSNNSLEMISEMAFHNSSQLQTLDLSYNKIDRIGDRTFEGLIRLQQLNLEGNHLSELPDTIFDRTKIPLLENINLSNNSFDIAPLNALQRQNISSINLSWNRIRDISMDSRALMMVKKLDLSFNPLSQDTLNHVLSDPKTIRELNLAATGIIEIRSLETPFLQSLNVSHNNIEQLNSEIFDRTTLLADLDLSNNKLNNMTHLSKIWPKLNFLQKIDLSNNSFETIAHGDFEHLDMLKELSLTNLESCTRIEKNAFKSLPNLMKLRVYNLPRLGYLDVHGIVELLPGLNLLDVELKDNTITSEHIQANKHPRLNYVGIRGSRLKMISSGTLAGLKAKNLNIKLVNTSLSLLPPALFFPVPRSSNLNLDITNSAITVLSPQLLSALEDRRDSLTLIGLDSNPIHCDCNARALRRWLPGSHMSKLKCDKPDFLKGKFLIEVGDDELTCDPTARNIITSSSSSSYSTSKKISSTPIGTSPTTPPPSTKALIKLTTTSLSEPEIIWSMAPTESPPFKLKTKSPTTSMKQYPLTNDDTLIIGIVGGVVAFIVILVIIFCIVRLRMTSNDYGSSAMMKPNSIRLGPPGSIPLSYGSAGGQNGAAAAIYAVPPYIQNYATLPSKGHQQQQQQQQQLQQQQHIQQQQQQQHHYQSNMSQIRPAYSTMGRVSYYQPHPHHHAAAAAAVSGSQQHQPFIILPDEKSYR